jgi:hypothetical protein
MLQDFATKFWLSQPNITLQECIQFEMLHLRIFDLVTPPTASLNLHCKKHQQKQTQQWEVSSQNSCGAKSPRLLT